MASSSSLHKTEGSGKYTTLDLQDGDRIGMLVNHGNFDHPIYGKADGVSGLIPFLLPFGTYETPTIVLDPPRLESLVNDMVLEYRDLWEDEMDDTIAANVKEYMLGAIYTNPSDDGASPGMRCYMSKCIVAVAADDMLDSASDLDETGCKYSQINRILELVFGIIDKEYKSVDEIPVMVPGAATPLKLMWLCERKFETAVTDYLNRKGPMREEWQNCVNAFILLMEKNPPGERFSEGSLKIFTAHNGGGLIALETISLIRNVTISEKIRREILVQNIMLGMANATTLINAIVGFARDVRQDEVRGTPILRLAVDKGVPLGEAFKIVLGNLTDEINDIRIASKKLRTRFSKDEHLDQWLRIVENYIDGQIYCYSVLKRYGEIEMKVVKL